MYKSDKNPNGISTQGYLRLEKALTSSSSIEFDVLANTGGATATEKRLNSADTFTVTKMAIFIYKLATSANPSAQALDTYPNAITYSKANEASYLMNVYNGFMSVRVDSVTYIDSLDLYRFYRVGAAQQGVGMSTYDATNNANNKYLADSWEGGDFGFYPINPTMTLSGQKTNKITITMPAALDLTGTSSTNYVVCYLRGQLNQTAARQ